MFEIIIPVIVIVLTLIGGFITWYLNERSKRIEEEYKHKEERYAELIKCLRGFYVDTFDKELREQFLYQLNLCWLYCPDEVIQSAYNFLEKVKVGEKTSDNDKEKAAGEFILAIRNDLLRKKAVKVTNLKPEDFKHMRAT